MVEEGFFLAGAVSFFVRVAACPRRVRARVCRGICGFYSGDSSSLIVIFLSSFLPSLLPASDWQTVGEKKRP